MVQMRSDIVGLDSAILQSRKVWQASGHEEVFTDPLVECRECNSRLRLDKLESADQCPVCGKRDSFTEPKQFNLMFRTHMGPIDSDENMVYLRPETAQGIFINYENVRRTQRLKLPFGIAQIGKSFRNEITPGQFVFRTREFEQMEMEFFCRPETAGEWFDYWVETRHQWYLDLGMDPDNLRIRPHSDDELSHYSAGTVDVDYQLPLGLGRVGGDRQPNRLRSPPARRAERRGSQVLRPGGRRAVLPVRHRAGRRCHPHGVCVPHRRLRHRTGWRRYPDRVADSTSAWPPISWPCCRSPRSPNWSRVPKRWQTCCERSYMLEVDVTQAIGRRYRRQDEIGTPYCLTFDFDSLDDRAVTVRDRDTMAQDRVSVDRLEGYLSDRFSG